MEGLGSCPVCPLLTWTHLYGISSGRRWGHFLRSIAQLVHLPQTLLAGAPISVSFPHEHKKPVGSETQDLKHLPCFARSTEL